MRREDLDEFIAAGTTARLSYTEAGAAQAEDISTSQALAELRFQLDAAAGEEDLSRLARILASIAESAPTLAERLKYKSD